MPTVKEINTDTGGNVTVEYSDDSLRQYSQSKVLAVSSEITGMKSGEVIISATAPTDADGKPDGTIYIQVV